MKEEDFKSSIMMISSKERIGDKLKACRESKIIDGKKLTRMRLSSILGEEEFSEVKIKNQETGKTATSARDIAVYSRFYEKSADYFLYDLSADAEEVIGETGLSKELMQHFISMNSSQKEYLSMLLDTGLLYNFIDLLDKYALNDDEINIIYESADFVSQQKDEYGDDLSLVNDFGLIEKIGKTREENAELSKKYYQEWLSLTNKVKQMPEDECEDSEELKQANDLFDYMVYTNKGFDAIKYLIHLQKMLHVIYRFNDDATAMIMKFIKKRMHYDVIRETMDYLSDEDVRFSDFLYTYNINK